MALFFQGDMYSHVVGCRWSINAALHALPACSEHRDFQQLRLKSCSAAADMPRSNTMHNACPSSEEGDAEMPRWLLEP